MEKQLSVVSLDVGYTNLEDDLNVALVYKDNGDQDFSKTLDNYIALLKSAVASLELVRDTTSKEESEDLELITNKNSTALCIKGNSEIVERYIGFGIANDNFESDDENCYGLSDDDDTVSDSGSDSSSEYNELCASDDTDTPIGSDDLDELDNVTESDSEPEPETKPKKSQKAK